jgi:monoamine oxidase
MSPDVLIVGAGVAGLAAAIDLARAGLRVEILEARDRVGGRVYTKQDPTLNHPVELGAEFVHGLAPEIWLPLQKRNIVVTEVDGDLWCSIDGKLQRCNFFGKADKILSAMNDRAADESFLDFLARRFPGHEHEDAKRWATRYVSGFNAADPSLVSVHWLVHSRDADEQIEGDRAFHIAGGYQTLLDILQAEVAKHEIAIHLNTTVSNVKWSQNSVEINGNDAGGDTTFASRRALITLPLGVLQSKSVVFAPQLSQEKQNALERLAMGSVVRVSLCFHERFWENLKPEGEHKTLADASFLFSSNDHFPTWWTEMPERVPIITGWAPARSAESMKGMSEGRIVDKAMSSLAELLHLEKAHLQGKLAAAYFHDWDSDPLSQGAYSYVKVGGEGCQHTLGAPLQSTLFFAGEATDISGHNGTVHGAMASGKRAAKDIIRAGK